MKVTIKIDAKFGSKFQSEFGASSLFMMLDAWKSHLERSHKKNIVVIKYGD